MGKKAKPPKKVVRPQPEPTIQEIAAQPPAPMTEDVSTTEANDYSYYNEGAPSRLGFLGETYLDTPYLDHNNGELDKNIEDDVEQHWTDQGASTIRAMDCCESGGFKCGGKKRFLAQWKDEILKISKVYLSIDSAEPRHLCDAFSNDAHKAAESWLNSLRHVMWLRADEIHLLDEFIAARLAEFDRFHAAHIVRERKRWIRLGKEFGRSTRKPRRSL